MRVVLAPAVLVVVLALAPSCAVVPAAAPAPPVDRTLSTSAEADVKVAPDQAVLTFTVTAEARDVSLVIAAVDAPTARVLAAAKKRGVKAEHLQSAQVSVSPKYVYDARGNAKQTGVVGTRTIHVTL